MIMTFKRTAVFMLTLFGAASVWAAEDRIGGAQAVIEPDIERRDITVPDIKAEDIEVSVLTGVLSIENFGSQAVYGLRGAYHITEDFFAEATYGVSTVSDTVFRNEPTGAIFANETEDVSYFNLALGVNLFPGEAFLAGRWSVGSDVYLRMGVGAFDFVGESKQMFNLGLGLRFLLNDWLTAHIGMEDLIFESDILSGQNRITHNFQMHLGLGMYF